MQGFAEKKKEEQKLLEVEKKKPAHQHAHLLGMSEGPMLLNESQGIEAQARASFEKSVKIELEAIRGKKKRKKGRKKGRKGKRKKKSSR